MMFANNCTTIIKTNYCPKPNYLYTFAYYTHIYKLSNIKGNNANMHLRYNESERIRRNSANKQRSGGRVCVYLHARFDHASEVWI